LRQRPVLMPGGWPTEASERETCALTVVASGGDLERVYDDSGMGFDAFIRYVCRVPVFKLEQERPLVITAGRIDSVVSLLAFYTRLFELTDLFDKASWLAYLPGHRVGQFVTDARAWGQVDDWGDELYCWYTSPIPVLLVSSRSQLSRLRQAVTDLEQEPASGVMSVSEPLDASSKVEHAKVELPKQPGPTPVSFNSLATLRLETQASVVRSPGRRTTPPPSNPRIRRHTG